MREAARQTRLPQSATAGPDPSQRELARIEAALARNPRNYDALIRAACWGERAQLHEFAAKFYAHAAAIRPLRPPACASFASILRQQSRHEEAVPLIKDAIGRAPGHAQLWLEMAMLMQDLGDDDNAETCLDEALRLAPNDRTARLERAALRHKRGRLHEARADCDYLVAIDPRDVQALYMRADVDFALGQIDRARAAYLALSSCADPAALRGRLERIAITAFHKDLVRADLASAGPDAPDGRPLHVVFFHADARTHGLSQVARTDYHGILPHSVLVARQRAGARIVMLTDRHTRFDPALGIDELVRDDVDTGQLMYERMRLQRNYVAKADGANVVFLDSDILVNRDPSGLFTTRFDVGLLWRTDMPDAPFVGGTILARGNAAALRFFDLALEAYRELETFPAIRAHHPEGIRRWWGDQYALAAVAGWRDFARRTSERMEVEGTILRFLPEREICRVPNAAAPAEMIDLGRPWFIHFKGDRKAAMTRMAARLLQLPA